MLKEIGIVDFDHEFVNKKPNPSIDYIYQEIH